MGQRIVRIILGLILTGICIWYYNLHDQNWIHSSDFEAIAAKEKAESDAFMNMYNQYAINTNESQAAASANVNSTTDDTVVVVVEPAGTVVEEPDAIEDTSGITAVVTNNDSAARTDGLPNVDISSWEFILANKENYIGEYEPEVQELEGQPLDYRIIEPMTQFVAAARDAGVPVYLSSGYRDFATQSYLYQRKIGQGYSPEEAATIVNPPGYSEHQTGLACDITDYYREFKDESLENTATYIWMSEHCQEYGFIVRYPRGKGDITGVIYEPWHFRYVGVEAATYIMQNNLCLEEFLALYQ